MSIQAKKLYPVGNGRITVTRRFDENVSVEDCIHAVLRLVDDNVEDVDIAPVYEDTQPQGILEA